MYREFTVCRPATLRWLFIMLMSWLVLGACGAAPESANVPTSTDANSAPANVAEQKPASQAPDLLAKPTGKLSAVLSQLAQPSVAKQSAEQQNQALGMQPTGPGSLIRNDQGQVLVVVRVSEVSDATLAALQAAGATVVNTADAYRSVTVYIDPERLNDLAAVPGVENVREESRPS